MAVLSCASALGCGGVPAAPGSSEPASPSREVVVVAVSSGPREVDPRRAADRYALPIASLAYPGLAKLDPYDGRVVADLAEGWTWSDDGQSVTVTLRAGPRWPDGSPVTAHDAAATLSTTREEAGYGFASMVSSASALDARTLIVTFDEPHCGALLALTTGLVERGSTGDGVVVPDGSGPYRVASWTPGISVTLVSSGAAATPGTPAIELRPYAGPSQALAALFSGEADVVTVEPKDVVLVEGAIAGGAPIELARLPTDGVAVLAMNAGLTQADVSSADPEGPAEPPTSARLALRDARVRQAVAHAIDVEGIIDDAMHGQADRVPSVLPPALDWAYDHQLAAVAHDPAKAATLLAEGGWIDGDGDGVRERGDTQLEAPILVSRGNVAHTLAAESIAADLSAAGFEATVVPLDYGRLLERVLAGRYDMALLELGAIGPEPDRLPLWAGDGDPPLGGLGSLRLADPSLERRLIAARTAPNCNPEVRADAYRWAQQRAREVLPVVPLYSPVKPVAWNRRLSGYRPGAWDLFAGLGDWP